MRNAITTLVAAAATANALPAAAPLVPPLCNALGVRRRIESSGGVALTFDDGPHPQGTPAALEALRRRNAVATFFLVGEQVERNPTLAREIVDAGHDVALHCQRHRNLLRLPPATIRSDLARAASAIAEATGREPLLQRPPYGIFSAVGLAIVRHGGWQPLLWSRWGRDWTTRATRQSIAARLTRDVGPGDVLLLHDSDAYSAPGSWRRTVAALPLVLDELDRRGLPLTRVD